MQFPKTGKYSVINKYTTFAHFCYPYVNLLNFVSFLHKPQQLIKKKPGILVKTKNTCLFTVNKYLLLLPSVDCAIVKLSQNRKQFQYQDVFYVNLSCFVFSLDSSTCLSNNILPDMYS